MDLAVVRGVRALTRTPTSGPPRVLVLNAGSSSLKASVVAIDGGVVDALPPLAAVTVELGDDATRGADASASVARAMQALLEAGVEVSMLEAVAHRIVHGGPDLLAPVIVDDRLMAMIDGLAPLAPLHNPVAAAVLRAARRGLGELPHVAVFDTAFHATLPESARRYPLPRAWDDWGIRRYGFHGLSVAWAVGRSAAMLGRPVDEVDLVVAHLGNGCSVTAVAGGRSVATSMGMTPLEGLMMGTRAGSVDPGILLAVLRDRRLSVDALAEVLDHGSGLLAVSGTSGDMRALEASADGGDVAATLAIEMFVERAAAGIAAAATSLDRLDAVVFTGGIGERAGRVRASIVDRLAVLGIAPIGREEAGSDRIIGGGGEKPAVIRIEAREDVVAAHAALDALGTGQR